MLKRSYQLTRIMGIPIRVHITLIILLPFLARRFMPFLEPASFFWGLLCAAGLFVCVGLHELGHSWVAIRKGCQVREIMLWPLGGVAKMSHIPSRARDEFLIAAAGPAVSALLALLCYLLVIPVAVLGAIPLAITLSILAYINIALCLFNLLPSFPMDGGRIFRAFMTPRIGHLKATALAVRIGRILAVAMGIWGLMRFDFILILIALYLYNAAGAEYRAVYAQHRNQEWFTAEQEADIHVSPPPYARKAPQGWDEWKKKSRSFLNGLFKS
jgi:Zn-dependent protease